MRAVLWLAGLVCAVAFFVSQPAFAETAPDSAKIDVFIKDLGDDDFTKRQTAEKELQKAGLAAKDALTKATASNDPQVKATAQRLLAQIKFATLPAIDYLSVIPDNSIISAHVTNVGNSWENIRKTAVGKLIESKALEAFRAKIEAGMNKEPEARALADMWVKRLKGQFAASCWELNFMAGPAGIKAGLIAEITDGDPVAAFNDLQNLGMGAGGVTTTYKDLEVLEGPGGSGAYALLGKHILLATNVDAMKTMVDNVLTPAGLNTAASFTKVKPTLGKHEMLITFDMEAYFTALAAMMPGGMDDVMKASGADDLKMFCMATTVAGGGFEDRFVAVLDPKPSGFRLASMPPAGSTPALDAMPLLPANAVLGSVFYMDGAKMATATIDYLEALKKMMAANAGAGDGAEAAFTAKLKEFEEKTGIKIDSIMANIKGDIGMYAVLPQPPAMLPDVGFMFTCVDAEKAAATAQALAKVANSMTGKPSVKQTPYKTHTINEFDLATIEGLNLPPQVKGELSPCFAVDGNRLYVSSTTAAMQKLLNNIDAKGPGLNSNPEFQKALASLPVDLHKGQIMFLDSKKLLTHLGTLGLPMLTNSVPDAEMKAALAALPPSAELFRDFPPMISSGVDKIDHSVTIIRGPIPPIPTVFFGAMVISLYATTMRR
jgi:hypothetical protein